MSRALACLALASLVALPCHADDVLKMLAPMKKSMDRLVHTIDVTSSRKLMEEAVQHVQAFAPKVLADAETSRRLTTSCSYTAALASVVNNGCGSTLPMPLKSNNTVFAAFCTKTCAAKLKEVLAPLLEKEDCKSSGNTIRLMQGLCAQGSSGGSTGYCMTKEKYTQSMSSLTAIGNFDGTVETDAYCSADSCFPHMIESVTADSDAQVKKAWDLIMKHMCLKPPGSSTSCWKEFAATLKNAAGVMNGMTQNPAAFCANTCQRTSLMDIMGMAKPTAQSAQMAGMVESMLDFACMQNSDKQYCMAIVSNSVTTPNTLNYDGALVTKPLCKEPESSNEGDKDDENHQSCNAADGMCAPWCKRADYGCNANIGKCDNFLKCDSKNGKFEQHSCTCASKIAQMQSAAGCCLGGLLDYMCKMMKMGITMANDTSIDISLCDIDATLSASKGFKVTKVMARVESCGFVTDPRCTHGKAVKTISFDLTFKNVDKAKVCAAPEVPAKQLQDTMAKTLSAAPSDVTVVMCPSSGRRLADADTLTPKVTIEASGATDLDVVKDIKAKAVKSGQLSKAIGNSVALTSSGGGKAVTLTAVGETKEASKNGVTGTSAVQAKEVMKTSMANKVESPATAASGSTSIALGMSTLLVLLASFRML